MPLQTCERFFVAEKKHGILSGPMPPEEIPQNPNVSPESLPARKISTIRTYQGDLNSVVRGDHISMTDIALKERARALRRGEETPAQQKTNWILIIFTIILVLGGIALIAYGLFFKQQNAAVAPQVEAPQSLVFANKETIIDIEGLEGAAITRRIRESLEKIRTLGEVEALILARKTITGVDAAEVGAEAPLVASEFFGILAPRAPGSFVRLVAPRFMYGVHGYDRNFGFLFFETDDQETVYSELLTWEKLSMARDLFPLLREESALSGIANPAFQDALVRNIDCRVLRNDAGEVVLIYAFLNPKTLLIAGSQETFVEILGRYTTPRPKTVDVQGVPALL